MPARDSDRPTAPTPLLHALVLDRAVAALLSEAMRDSPLNAHDYGVASAISDEPGISASQLAVQFSTPLTTIAEWVGRLTSLGVVRRERDPRDGRRHQLWITPEGEVTMAAARSAFGRGYLAFADRLPVSPNEASTQLEAMTRACREALTVLQESRSDD
ncbi:MarR family transcriptional regulator [Ornithinimicrobium faecis]|uniref:MarR family transcriptional regulator n=1 Tax=Ornithinimicrobium faecis TaxID=2934158 RepID=A0ABY4YP73_9MICO|nr:MarR family transcriptional regulator [Ornithinimicrobium sp. HY1793]USQ78577.1 MarR family transcriptional regulator [Ornithinimicrobium sp. HY1793]